MTMKNRDFVHVRVIKHLPQGLSVELDNGERGIVRIREISWNEEEVANWKNAYPIGWDGYAFSIPSKKNGAREFSLRLAKSDPWDELFAKGFDKNKVFEGVVTSVFEYGAFIEIVLGVTGLLRKSRIPSSDPISIPDLFWHGDRVLVVIRDVDHTQRQIELSLAPAEDHLESPATITCDMKSRVKKIEDKIPRRYILVVEDEISQSNAICDWLHDLNQSVTAVFSAEEALDFLVKTSPSIAMVDIGLPVMSGTDIAKYILENCPNVQVVIIANWASASEIKNVLDELQTLGAKLLYKPLLPEDLETYLLHEQDQKSAITAQKENLFFSNIPNFDTRKSIHALLAICKKQLEAEQVILFSFDVARRSIHVSDHVGDGITNRNAIAQLIYSPVRDVAEDCEIIVVNKINERDQKRFQYLLEFSPAMASCLGVPVPAQTTAKYALFALDRQAKQFSAERQIYAQGTALAIGAALDQHDLRERSALMQRSALIGNLASGMMHEINNLVSPLMYRTNALEKKMAQVKKDKNEENLNNYAVINDDIIEIQKDVRKIINTTKAFYRIVEKGKNAIVRIDEVIDGTIILLREISKNSNVLIHFAPPDELVVVRSQSIVLEQIILNVILNAIQQIGEFHPNSRGWIKISMQLAHEIHNEIFCRVLIEDNGPGIHAKLWEKVFEAGYTTRREGSGIGLYVSRNLMRDVGGEIFISKSHILRGTTFVLEFPVNL